MKRIATMQDISCIGKCSLTVALPIISAMGVETAVIPTAVLSTHTAFKGFTFHDLTGEIEPITAHWKKEGFAFDALYTGYLGSFEQLKLAEKLFKEFRTDRTIVLVDPCMADNGNLYPGFTREFAASMAELCRHADIIVPNLTEASYMLNIPYPGDNYDEAYVKDTLKKLTALGCPKAVLTGISLTDGRIGAYSYDALKDEYFYYDREELPQHFHGTGDIFASTFVGALMNDKGFEESLKIATDYVVECIRLTLENAEHNWYGVEFERAIPYLLERLYR